MRRCSKKLQIPNVPHPEATISNGIRLRPLIAQGPVAFKADGAVRRRRWRRCTSQAISKLSFAIAFFYFLFGFSGN